MVPPPLIYKYRRRRDRIPASDDDDGTSVTKMNRRDSDDRPNFDSVEVSDENRSSGLIKEDSDKVRDFRCIDETEIGQEEGSINLVGNLDDLFSGFVYNSPLVVDDSVSIEKEELGSEVRIVSPYFKEKCDSEIVSSQNGRNCSKRCKKVEAEVRRVSPYFKSSADSQCDSEIVSSQSGKYHNKRCKKVQAEVRRVSPYFKSSADSQCTFSEVVSSQSGRRSDRKETGEVQAKKVQRNLGQYYNVRKVSRYFHDVSAADGTQENESQKERSRSRRVRKTPVVSPTLSRSQKNDEAYLRKTPDNTWVPPRSPCNLLQEDHWRDPWRVLVICMLLNRTSGAQTRGVIAAVFALCPDAKTATEVEEKEIETLIKPLGMQKKRAKMIQRLSQEYLEENWTHVTQLHGVGKYAADAYAIFCNGKWDCVSPDDHMLNYYWDYLWIRFRRYKCKLC
ncbi:unnamed protein product [Microthlaspi erraticum]|uniref:HhH-GPD domain-containing protein n=1 Tax=Microthlaspi erraticum TaxID=1685480 RepID=A0A6D2K2W6_9BRAS|nr:unnamed protein product [Microthlaspi erraticum]